MMKKSIQCLACFMVTIMMCTSVGVQAMEPIANDFVKVSAQNQVLTFGTEDFKNSYIDMDSEVISKIKFVSLPGFFGEGKLLLNGRKVKEGQEISMGEISTLCFQPKNNFTGEVRLVYRASDGKDYSNEAALSIIVDPGAVKQSMALVDKDVMVYENSPKKLSAIDGSLKLAEKKIKLITTPENGTIDKIDAKTGEMIYTPNENYTGDDKFTFCVTDVYGRAKTASIHVFVAENVPTSATSAAANENSKIQIVYSDLANHWAEYPVMKLTQSGIIVGEKLKNNTAFFRPQAVVNRVEFLNMVLASTGTYLNDKATSSGVFSDCANEPAWVQETINTAYHKGLINGTIVNGKRVFNPYDNITRSEAAVILNKAISPKTATCIDMSYQDMNTVPVWANQSVKNMTCYGVFHGVDNHFEAAKVMTRAESAELCYQTLKYLQEN